MPDKSLELAAKMTETEVCPLGLTLMAAGQVITGGVVSTTLTGKTGHETDFPALSVAEHVIDVELPSSKNEPDPTGLQPDVAIPEASEAEKAQVTLANGMPVEGETRRGLDELNGGHVTVGFAASETVTLNEHELTLLALSVAEQVTVEVPIGAA